MTATNTILEYIRKEGKTPHMIWTITYKSVRFHVGTITLTHPTKGITIRVIQLFETKGMLSVVYTRKSENPGECDVVCTEALPTKGQIHFPGYDDETMERIGQRNEHFASIILNALQTLKIL